MRKRLASNTRASRVAFSPPTLIILPLLLSGVGSMLCADEQPTQDARLANLRGDPKATDGPADSRTRVFDSAEEKYVYENIAGFLSPSSIRWLEDGRVEMFFDLRRKSAAHDDIFSTPVGNKNKDRFRWSHRDEEIVIGGIPGIRLSDAGAVVLRAWYVDDVEAEIQYRQYINQSKRHVLGVMFQNEKGKALGTNYGDQVAMFSKGRIGKRSGQKIKPMSFNATARFRISMKDGVIETHRDGYLASKARYKPKSFPRGQIGIVWGGSQSGTVGSIKVTGKLDYVKMKSEMRRKRPSGHRRR